MFGYVKIGAAVPQLKLADCISNKEEILKLIREAKKRHPCADFPGTGTDRLHLW